MRPAQDLLARLAREHYRPRKIPGEHDGAIASGLGRVDSAAAFAAFASGIDADGGRVLNSFAFRMATVALRRRELAWIQHGLVAAQLAMTVGDDRGILPSYALLYRGAELIGADADALFRSASFLAEDPMWETPAQFAGRGPNDRSIEVFGMMLVTDRAGVTFRPKG